MCVCGHKHGDTLYLLYVFWLEDVEALQESKERQTRPRMTHPFIDHRYANLLSTTYTDESSDDGKSSSALFPSPFSHASLSHQYSMPTLLSIVCYV